MLGVTSLRTYYEDDKLISISEAFSNPENSSTAFYLHGPAVRMASDKIFTKVLQLFWLNKNEESISDLSGPTDEYRVGAMHGSVNSRVLSDWQIAIHELVCGHENVVSWLVKHEQATGWRVDSLLVNLPEVRRQQSYGWINPEHSLMNMQHVLHIE